MEVKDANKYLNNLVKRTRKSATLVTRGKSGKGVTGRGNNTCRALGVFEKKGAVWAERVRGTRGDGDGPSARARIRPALEATGGC